MVKNETIGVATASITTHYAYTEFLLKLAVTIKSIIENTNEEEGPAVLTYSLSLIVFVKSKCLQYLK